jgi:hypothetical protein
MCFFHSPEGVFPLHTSRTFLPLSRGSASVPYTLRFFRFPEGLRPLRMACVFLPLSRRSVSVAHGVWFFHDPERSLPLHTVCGSSTIPKDRFRCTRLCGSSTIPKDRFRSIRLCISSTAPKSRFRLTQSYVSSTTPKSRFRRTRSHVFFHPPEGALPLRAPCVSSAFPKDRFRHARPPFPSASSSEKHCQCVEKRLPHSLCGPLLSLLLAEANHSSISSPTGSALIGPESNAGTCPFRVPTSCSLFASFTIAEASVSVASSNLPPFSDHLPLVSRSCDPSSFDITANCFWYDPTPVTHSREVDDLHRRSERLVSL